MVAQGYLLIDIFTVQMHTDRSAARTRAALYICIIKTTLASGPVNNFKNVNSLLFTLTPENTKWKYFLIKSFFFCFMNILFCYWLFLPAFYLIKIKMENRWIYR